jgi:hypothetical protein
MKPFSVSMGIIPPDGLGTLKAAFTDDGMKLEKDDVSLSMSSFGVVVETGRGAIWKSIEKFSKAFRVHRSACASFAFPKVGVRFDFPVHTCQWFLLWAC